MNTDHRLRFAHRFKTGALCEVEIDLNAVFATVADRTGVPLVWCFMHPNGLSETWLFEPWERPQRIAKADEPCRNAAAAIVLAATAKFATQGDGGGRASK
jgi:hypothetical protein